MASTTSLPLSFRIRARLERRKREAILAGRIVDTADVLAQVNRELFVAGVVEREVARLDAAAVAERKN